MVSSPAPHLARCSASGAPQPSSQRLSREQSYGQREGAYMAWKKTRQAETWKKKKKKNRMELVFKVTTIY